MSMPERTDVPAEPPRPRRPASAPAPQLALALPAGGRLATLLPFAPGGLGTKQALCVLVLAGKAPTGPLLAFGVAVNLTLEAANLLLGLIALAL
jgi:hypothetical protein